MWDHLVIGGGISGLSAAHEARFRGESVSILEASPRAGGVIQTLELDDPQTGHHFLLETGPHTFAASAHRLIELAHQVGLTPQAVSAVAKKRYVAKNGRLHAVPMDPLSFLTTPLLSLAGKAYLLGEPFRAPIATAPDDPSVSSWITHRLGGDVLDWLVAPFLSGIYAGDPEHLGARSIFASLLDWEDSQGSLAKGAFDALKKKRKTMSRSAKSASSTQLLGFPQGMQTFIDALVKELPSHTLNVNTKVDRIEKSGQGYKVWLDSGESRSGTSLSIAVPAPEAARLLSPMLPEASLLTEIPYAPVALLHVAVPNHLLRQPLDGFGFLVPHQEKTPLLGCIWASALFSTRSTSRSFADQATPSRSSQALLSCFVGGMRNRETLSWTDAELMTAIKPALARYHGVVNDNAFQLLKVIRWPSAIPQYIPGHRSRMRALVSTMADQLPNLTLRGNYGFGIALHACLEPMAL
ncbi:MAG: protoporphyrinogen oxidase [Vampirovibrionales bacterium]|nr:protoporphyrinogen oxidase [Vampirovibrionales bacterium]